MLEKDKGISRRAFMGASASAAFAFSIVDSKVLGADAPSNKLDLAIIGAGGQGGYSLKNTTSENLVAIADVDKARSAGAAGIASRPVPPRWACPTCWSR